MPHSNRTMTQLCRAVSREIGDGVTPEQLERYERYLVALANKRAAHQGRFPKNMLWAAGILIIVASTVVFTLLSRDPEVGFFVGGKFGNGVVGAQIRTDNDETVPLTFQLGGHFVVHPETIVRVARALESEVCVKLENGRLSADIDGNGHTRWRVSAGPYRVTVLGTAFTVNWNDAEERLDVEVDRGTVLVEGSAFAEEGIRVTGGNRFSADRRRGFLGGVSTATDRELHDTGFETGESVSTTVAKTDPTLNVFDTVSSINERAASAERFGYEKCLAAGRKITEPEEEIVDNQAQGRRREQRSRASSESITESVATMQNTKDTRRESDFEDGASVDSRSGNENERWWAFAKRREYEAAFEEAQREGIPALLATAERRTVWTLAHVARAVGRSDVAIQAATACRERFSGSYQARTAAYLLGRIAMDETKDLRTASQWFDTYLTESPNGPLAEESLGRLMSVYRNRNQVEKSVAAANDYLQKYPGGSFSHVAEAILDAPTP